MFRGAAWGYGGVKTHEKYHCALCNSECIRKLDVPNPWPVTSAPMSDVTPEEDADEATESKGDE